MAIELQVSGERRCTKIEDRNGNYISATYNTSNGHILTITDTLGRVVNFNYNGDNNLTTITQTWAGATHTWATFVYGSVYMSFSFPGLYSYGVTNGSYQTVLSYIAFADSTQYNFDYNSYGQAYQIRHKAPDGHELEHTFYNINTSGSQTDCPRFTDRRDYAQDWNNNLEAFTYYSVTNNAYARFVYESNGNYVHSYQTIIDTTQANEFHSWQIMDGAGRVRAMASDHPGSAGGFTGQYTVYNNMGRVSQQSNPTEMNGSW